VFDFNQTTQTLDVPNVIPDDVTVTSQVFSNRRVLKAGKLVDNFDGTYTWRDIYDVPGETFTFSTGGGGGGPSGRLVTTAIPFNYQWIDNDPAFTFGFVARGAVDADQTSVRGNGNGTPLRAGILKDNGDGTFTWTDSSYAEFTFSATSVTTPDTARTFDTRSTRVVGQYLTGNTTVPLTALSITLANPSFTKSMRCLVTFKIGENTLFFTPDSYPIAPIGANIQIDSGVYGITTGGSVATTQFEVNRIAQNIGYTRSSGGTFLVSTGGSTRVGVVTIPPRGSHDCTLSVELIDDDSNLGGAGMRGNYTLEECSITAIGTYI
jgi:hypothetical protein